MSKLSKVLGVPVVPCCINYYYRINSCCSPRPTLELDAGGTRNIQLDPLTGRFLAQAQAGPRSASQHKSEAIQAVEEDLQKEPSEPGLSEEEAALAQILLKLHVDDRTKLLQLLPALSGGATRQSSRRTLTAGQTR